MMASNSINLSSLTLHFFKHTFNNPRKVLVFQLLYFKFDTFQVITPGQF